MERDERFCATLSNFQIFCLFFLHFFLFFSPLFTASGWKNGCLAAPSPRFGGNATTTGPWPFPQNPGEGSAPFVTSQTAHLHTISDRRRKEEKGMIHFLNFWRGHRQAGDTVVRKHLKKTSRSDSMSGCTYRPDSRPHCRPSSQRMLAGKSKEGRGRGEKKKATPRT